MALVTPEPLMVPPDQVKGSLMSTVPLHCKFPPLILRVGTVILAVPVRMPPETLREAGAKSLLTVAVPLETLIWPVGVKEPLRLTVAPLKLIIPATERLEPEVKVVVPELKLIDVPLLVVVVDTELKVPVFERENEPVLILRELLLTKGTLIPTFLVKVLTLIVPLLVKTPEPDCSEKLVVAEVLLKLIVAPAGLLRAAPV